MKRKLPFLGMTAIWRRMRHEGRYPEVSHANARPKAPRSCCAPKGECSRRTERWCPAMGHQVDVWEVNRSQTYRENIKAGPWGTMATVFGEYATFREGTDVSQIGAHKATCRSNDRTIGAV